MHSTPSSVSCRKVSLPAAKRDDKEPWEESDSDSDYLVSDDPEEEL